MAEIKVFGYTDKITVKSGDEISFHATIDGTDRAQAQLVRLIHGDQHPNGPGFIEEEIRSSIDGEWSLKKQFTQVGSFLKVADPNRKLALDGSFTLYGFIWPTLHGEGVRQALIGRWDLFRNEGYCLGINQKGV